MADIQSAPSIPRIAGLPPTLEQLIRHEYERMVKAGVHADKADSFLRISITDCAHNACEMVRWQGPK